MKRITLNKLTLKNFQGGMFTFEPAEEDVNVHGQNGAGKTRIASAFSWLLFGKDSLGRTDFSIKNLDATGQTEHNLQHSVEAILNVDDERISLKKTYSEVWTKKRGSAEATFTGHTNDFHINGVPCQKKEFDATVAEVAGPEETFRLLTSPTVFPALAWQKQRSLLLEICGDISDSDVIASDPALSDLPGILGKHTLDEHKKVVAARRAEINKNLPQVAVRIDEVKRGFPDITNLDRNKINTDIVNLEYTLSEARLKLSGIDNGSTIADLSKKLTVINADISKLEQSYYQDGMKAVSRINQQIQEISDNATAAERKTGSIRAEIAYKKERVTGLEIELQQLREKWIFIDSETFEDSTDKICPACGQSLPEERVQEAREKALAAFNLNKADRLSVIEKRGHSVSAELERVKSEIENLHGQLTPGTSFDPEQVTRLVAERDNIKAIVDDYSRVPGRDELIEKRKEIEIGIEAAKECTIPQRESAQEEVSRLQELLNCARVDADKFTRIEQGEKRISQLKEDEKRLAREFEDLERQLYLIETFIKAKVSMLTERINSKFEIVRFKLFETQVNQGISECCEIMVNGVGYNSGLNSAARTQGGLDIIRTLQKHYELSCPIWIDNRESCTEIPDMNCQILSLIVSPSDKVLRVETAKKERIAA